MPLAHQHALFGPRFLRHLGRLVRLYWMSDDAPRGGILLAITVALEVASVYGVVLLSDAQRQMFDAFGDKNMAAFSGGVALFLLVGLGYVVVSTYRIYVRGRLEIRWRGWLTDHFLGLWMDPRTSCQMELHRKATDNPDQRIAEDIREFVASALGLSLSLLSAFATLLSFATILWTLSGTLTIELGKATHLRIPGLMMWVAIGYALLASWITHRVGRCLVPIQFDRQRFEADFRYKLVRFRENVEPIALAAGEVAELRLAMQRFGNVVSNWWELIRAQRNLAMLTTGIGQANSLVPLLVAAPAYFSGHMTLGAVIQTRIAYGEVSGALTWFVNAYQEIARWRANVERLVTLQEEIDLVRTEVASAAGVQVQTVPDGALRLEHLRLARPDGTLLIEDANAEIRRGDHIALFGPTGAGKRTLLRTIAGIWRFGSGRIELPLGAKIAFLPQRPHIPIGTLRDAVTYPDPPGTVSDDRIRATLRGFDLGALADRLDESRHWQHYLSGGEQQRLALARTLLHEPDWIFLDEATSGLDEESERRAYALLREKLPRSAVVSIADRPSIAALHERHWRLRPLDGATVLEAA